MTQAMDKEEPIQPVQSVQPEQPAESIKPVELEASGETPQGGIQGGRATLRSELVEYLQAFLIAIVLAAFIITFVAQSFVVQGSSMEPTLHNGERLLVNKFVYRFSEPKRGQIIVFRFPANPKRKFIKRVIGVAGDIVAVKDGRVILNGEPLEEPYILDSTLGDWGPEIVPEGRIFVLGDNRNNSEDSRYSDVGFVPIKNVVGQAFVIYWPPTKIGLVRRAPIGP